MVAESLVEAVKTHAIEHYEDGGWDVVVECCDDEWIADTIGTANTVEEAVAAVQNIVDVWADRHNSAF